LNKIKEKKYYKRPNILEILSKNKYFLFKKIKFICIKQKNYRWIKIIFLKLNTHKIIFKKAFIQKKKVCKAGLGHEMRINW